MRTVIPSLKDNNWAYVLGGDSFSNYRNDMLDMFVTKFETFGDATVQHSPEIYATRKDLIDFCYSTSAYVIDIIITPERMVDDKITILSDLHYKLPRFDVSDDKIEFATSVRYKKDDKTFKRQFFSLELQKVSSNDKYQYDKRWHEVPSHINGDNTINDVIWMFTQDDNYQYRMRDELFEMMLFFKVQDILTKKSVQLNSIHACFRKHFPSQGDDYNCYNGCRVAIDCYKDMLRTHAGVYNLYQNVKQHKENINRKEQKELVPV